MAQLSVVIPAYNAAATIEATIASVLAQTEPSFELIVVDDGSADATPALVEDLAARDERVTLIRQPNAGTAGARNTGIAHARGDYVSFLDNDDLWMPNYLDRMRAALDAEPGAGFAYCDAWSLDDASSRISRITEMQRRPGPEPGASTEAILLTLAAHNFVQSSATVRRTVLAEVGGFDPSIRGTDDYDLWLRILLAGHGAVRAAPEPLMIQRGREGSQSKDETMMLRGEAAALERVRDDPRAPSAVRERVERSLSGVERDLALAGGASALPRALGRLRAAAVRLRNAALRDRYWYSEPPAEVTAAFPSLRRTSR